MTFIRTRAGFLHLSILLDLYSRRIVGWSMGDLQTTELALNSLGMALLQRMPKPGLIHHTDRGSAYSSNAYRACLQNNGIISSMSRAYRHNQNAYAERFFNSLKREFVNNTHFPDKDTARTGIFEYIEIFYNRQRRHVALGYVSPADFEEQKGASMVSL
jgi:transposase InsO family protein